MDCPLAMSVKSNASMKCEFSIIWFLRRICEMKKRVSSNGSLDERIGKRGTIKLPNSNFVTEKEFFSDLRSFSIPCSGHKPPVTSVKRRGKTKKKERKKERKKQREK